MKKSFFYFLTIVILLFVGYFIYQNFISRASSTAEVLPERAYAFVELKDVKNQMNEFHQTEIWQQLQAVHWESVLKALPNGEIINHLVQGAFEEWEKSNGEQIINTFFSENIALGLYPKEERYELGEDLKYEMWNKIPDLFLVTKVSNAHFKELLGTKVLPFVNEVQFEEKKYKDKVYYLADIFPKLGAQVSIVRIKDHIVLGFGDHIARRVIDVSFNSIKPLSQSAHFQDAQNAQLSFSKLLGYIDVQSFVNAVLNSMDGSVDFGGDLSHIQGIQWGGLSAQFGEIPHFQTKWDIDVSKIPVSKVSSHEKCVSRDNSTLQFVPQSVGLYQWFACLDFPKYWKEMKAQALKTEVRNNVAGTVAKNIQSIEGLLGVSLENELLPALGDEIGWWISSGSKDKASILPIAIPEFLIFLKSDQGQKLASIFDRVLNQPLLSRVSESYQNIDVVSFRLPIGQAIAPTYAFHNGFFFFGLNSGVVQNAIDVSKGKSPSIHSSPFVKKKNDVLNQKGINMHYVQWNQILKAYDSVIGLVQNPMVQGVIGSKSKSQTPSQAVKTEASSIFDTLNDSFMKKQKELLDLEDQIWQTELDGGDSSNFRKRSDLIRVEMAEIREKMKLARSEMASTKFQKSKDGHLPEEKTSEKEVPKKLLTPLLNVLKSMNEMVVSTKKENNAFTSDLFMSLN